MRHSVALYEPDFVHKSPLLERISSKNDESMIICKRYMFIG